MNPISLAYICNGHENFGIPTSLYYHPRGLIMGISLPSSNVIQIVKGNFIDDPFLTIIEGNNINGKHP
jgi:hypothetical protein